MITKRFNKTARYYGGKIEIPYIIEFYYLGTGGPKTYAEVVVNWNEMKVKGKYCKSIKDLSNKQLNELDIETEFLVNPKGRTKKYQKSSARHLVYKKLEGIIRNPQIRGLIH